jgi:hypothetical protein
MSPRLLLRSLNAVVLFFVASTLSPTVVRAEEGSCGNHCTACVGSPAGYKYGSGSSGDYLHYCSIGGCVKCSSIPTSRKSELAPAEIAKRIKAAIAGSGEVPSDTDLRQLRMLRSRSAVAVLGGCSGESVVALIPLSEAEYKTLASRRVALLDSGPFTSSSRTKLIVAR